MNELPGLGTLPDIGIQGALLDSAPVMREVVGDVHDPVAHVHVVLSQPHLDRVFDYLVPRVWDSAAVVGARVQVDIAGSRAHGFIVARDSQSDVGAKLRPLRKVYSAVPVLTDAIYREAIELARRKAGSVSDVLRLAIPQRHARAERSFGEGIASVSQGKETQPGILWESYRGGPAFLKHIEEGNAPAAVVHALPGHDQMIGLIGEAARSARLAGRGVLIVVPSIRDVLRIAPVIEALTGESVCCFRGDEPHDIRYTAFLGVLGGIHRVVVTTRGGAWLPVKKLGLIVIYDESNETLREPHAPYYDAIDVAHVRSQHEGAALLRIAPYVTPRGIHACESGRVVLVEPHSTEMLARVPRVSAADQWERSGEQWARLPESAFSLVRTAITNGPVLVVVPRSGYIPLVACQGCGTIATCHVCGGSLRIEIGANTPRCTRCGYSGTTWRCPTCNSGQLRAARIGSHRTAQEIGRAFPGITVQLSGGSGGSIIDRIDSTPRIVVATPGAEPVADMGFVAALVLDSRFLRGDGTGSDIEFIRKVSRIASRVRGSRDGGHVMFTGGIDPHVVAMLNRWDHTTFATALLEERRSLTLPPCVPWLAVTGSRRSLTHFLATLRRDIWQCTHVPQPHSSVVTDPLLAGGIVVLTPGIELLGPVPGTRQGELTMYVRDVAGVGLAQCARRSYREFTAKHAGESLRIEMDPSL